MYPIILIINNLQINNHSIDLRMLQRLILLIIPILLTSSLFGQTEAEEDSKASKHHIYLETLGISGRGRTYNYEYQLFHKEKLKIQARAGVGTAKRKDFTDSFNPDLTIPFGVNAFYGNVHHVEFGIGQVITSVIHADIETYEPTRVHDLHGNLTIGYRYQKQEGGLLLRLSYTPLLEFNEKWNHWAGFSIGYSF